MEQYDQGTPAAIKARRDKDEFSPEIPEVPQPY